MTWVAAGLSVAGLAGALAVFCLGKWHGRRAAWAELASDTELRRTTLEWLAKMENMRLVGYE